MGVGWGGNFSSSYKITFQVYFAEVVVVLLFFEGVEGVGVGTVLGSDRHAHLLILAISLN